ncbi:MAG: nucleotide excision repair endonuclease, partial [Thermodesulfobacteriota bacterium]
MGIDREKAQAIPPSPGVYLLKDGKGKSLYVGKAKNLRSRVFSYLNDGEEPARPHIA